jgi:hypothetical protein
VKLNNYLTTATLIAGVAISSAVFTQIAKACLLPQQNNATAQLTSVLQLSDVAPSDYYFDALQVIVELYGISVGYPDGTFRASQMLSESEYYHYMSQACSRVNELRQFNGLRILNYDTCDETLLSSMINAGSADPFINGISRGDFIYYFSIALSEATNF